nr:DUF4832 domain-containing protein [bacterium]
MIAMKNVYLKEIHEVLVNPGMGFKTFQRFNGDLLNEGTRWTEGYPIEYQRDRGTLITPEHPLCSLSYFRIYWRFMEPEEGQYRWDLIDKALYYSRMRGQTMYLRIAPYGNGGPQDDVPDWFRAKVGPRPDSVHSYWRVDHEDPCYIDCFGRFIRALAARYDGHPDLECVDISIIGFWGEGEGSNLVSQQTREALMDPYLDGFKKTLMVIQMTDPKTVGYGLEKCDHLGWRVDCLGDMRGSTEPGRWCHMLDLYPVDVIECGLEDAWKTGPVSLEVCWVMQHWLNMGWDIDYIIEQSLRWHINNFNSKSSRVPPEWQDKVDYWLKKMGYRLAPRKFSYSSEVTPGGQLEYFSWWSNLGVAPVYHRYPLALRLKNDHFAAILKTDEDLRRVLPGDAILKGSVQVPQDVPAGEYMLELGVLNEWSDKPFVSLAIEGKTADGWYPLSTITVAENQ